MSTIIEIREYVVVNKMRYLESRLRDDRYIADVQGDLVKRLVTESLRFCEFQAQEDTNEKNTVIVGAKLLVCPPNLSDNVIRQQLLKLEDIKDNRRRGRESNTWR